MHGEYKYFIQTLSLVTRKPVFGVCDQVRLEPACSATETSYRLAVLDIETRGINGIIYNDSLYTTDLYISAYNILVCETIVDQDQQRL